MACLCWLMTGASPAVALIETATPAQETQPIHSISYKGQELLSSFNSARDETRLILVFSPT